MRPLLKPSLRRLWRDRESLQLGLNPDGAPVITGIDPPTARLLDHLDGTRSVEETCDVAEGLGLARDRAMELITALAAAEALEDASGRSSSRPPRKPSVDLTAPDRATAAILRNATDGGLSVMTNRAATAVAVHGAGRVGSAIAVLLAAAGVGHVAVTDREPARPRDATPAGYGWEDVRRSRELATRQAMRRAAPGVRSSLPAGRDRPDLAVVVPETRPDPQLASELVERRVPHLFADVRETSGVVGPFVIPGRTACGRCLDLHRTDRDDRWPHLLAQLAGSPGLYDMPCDTVLATSVAARAAMQVLMFVDGDTPSAVDRTLEIRLPDGELRTRRWWPHERCGCGAAAWIAAEPAAARAGTPPAPRPGSSPHNGRSGVTRGEVAQAGGGATRDGGGAGVAQATEGANRGRPDAAPVTSGAGRTPERGPDANGGGGPATGATEAVTPFEAAGARATGAATGPARPAAAGGGHVVGPGRGRSVPAETVGPRASGGGNARGEAGVAATTAGGAPGAVGGGSRAGGGPGTAGGAPGTRGDAPGTVGGGSGRAEVVPAAGGGVPGAAGVRRAALAGAVAAARTDFARAAAEAGLGTRVLRAEGTWARSAVTADGGPPYRAVPSTPGPGGAPFPDVAPALGEAVARARAAAGRPAEGGRGGPTGRKAIEASPAGGRPPVAAPEAAGTRPPPAPGAASPAGTAGARASAHAKPAGPPRTPATPAGTPGTRAGTAATPAGTLRTSAGTPRTPTGTTGTLPRTPGTRAGTPGPAGVAGVAGAAGSSRTPGTRAEPAGHMGEPVPRHEPAGHREAPGARHERAAPAGRSGDGEPA